jgi:hypothetical protein
LSLTARALLCTVVLGGCSTLPQSSAIDFSVATYVMSMASAYRCSCARWPASVEQLASFDEALHARSRAEGNAPENRIAWSTLSRSTLTATSEEELLVSIVADGESAPLTLGVRRIDCSSFNGQVVADLCPSD